jgi:hypothetical protein
LDVSLPNYVFVTVFAGDDDDMNIQGPLLLLGITATTTVGLGTVAVNSGAVNIDDVSGLLAQTVPAVSGTTAGQGVAASSTIRAAAETGATSGTAASTAASAAVTTPEASAGATITAGLSATI